VTAPTDHLAAARAAMDKTIGPLSLALAQVHATLALAEEARTANLIAALDYGALGPVGVLSDERRAEITARLWPAS